MKRILLVALLLFPAGVLFGQGFEIVNLQDSHKGLIGEIVKAPIRFKNNTDKALTLIIRKVSAQIGSTQKTFFCVGNDCLDSRVDDYIIKVEPGQTLTSFTIALDAGIVAGVSTVKYVAFSKSSPNHSVEFDVNFTVEEKQEKQIIYNSKDVTIKDVYPNPVLENAYVDYTVISDQVKAKIIVNNLLGNMVGEYPLTPTETLVRISTDNLSSGIYFYTLYVNNKSVMTRKLIIRK